jgi:3-deoxy-D-manno-octulosonic-acid transferase
MIIQMKYLIDAAYLFAAAAVSPFMVYRMIKQNRYRIGWSNRFGSIMRRESAKKCVWIHAVSVGEVNAAKTVVDELAKRLPDYEILITTTTDTGFARANAVFGKEHTVAFFPLDFSVIMQRAFRNIKPAVCLLMELEVWPNFVEIAHKMKIPVAVVNGRLSQRSLERYQKVNFLTKRIFHNIAAVFAQTEE